MSLKNSSVQTLNSIDSKQGNYTGYAYALLCHFLFVVSGYLFKRESLIISPYQIQYSNGLQFIVYNYLSLKYNNLEVCPKNLKTNRMLALRGTIAIVGACCGTLGYVLTPLSEAVALQMTTPAVTSILAIFFLSEKYDFMLFLNTTFCMAGVLLICKPAFLFGTVVEMEDYPYRSAGIGLLLIGAIIGGFVQVLIKKLGSMTNAFAMTFYFGFFIALSGAMCQIWSGIATLQFQDVIVSVVIGIMQFLGQYLMNKSYTFGNVGSISLIFYSQVPIAYIIDLVFEGLTPQFSSVMGSLSIFSCVFVMFFRQNMTSKTPK